MLAAFKGVRRGLESGIDNAADVARVFNAANIDARGIRPVFESVIASRLPLGPLST